MHSELLFPARCTAIGALKGILVSYNSNAISKEYVWFGAHCFICVYQKMRCHLLTSNVISYLECRIIPGWTEHDWKDATCSDRTGFILWCWWLLAYQLLLCTFSSTTLHKYWTWKGSRPFSDGSALTGSSQAHLDNKKCSNLAKPHSLGSAGSNHQEKSFLDCLATPPCQGSG